MKHIRIFGLAAAAVLLASCNGANEEAAEEQPVEEEAGETEEAGEAEEETEDTAEEENGEVETVEESEAEPLIMEEDVFDDGSIQALVNKEHHLDADYVPHDLVAVEVPTVLENPEINQLREEASSALTELFDAALEEDLTLYARSGYRSYNTQVSLYNNYKEAHGEAAADRFSARPGASEHQTGLAMDVTSESVNYELSEAFGETEEGVWVKENAHDYGFIIRYPEGREDITGYSYEPWHLRYLGAELASDIHEGGLTYEEYIEESGMDIEENGEE